MVVRGGGRGQGLHPGFLLAGPWNLSLRYGAMMSSVMDNESLQVPEISTWTYLVGTFYMGLEVGKEDQAGGRDARHQHGYY